MIYSMTGFARLERAIPEGRIAWELRAVNHRYLDLSLRLPEELRSLEPKLRNIVRERLRRGKLEATLRYHAAIAGDTLLELDAPRLAALGQAARSIGDSLDTAPPSPLEVLQWPGVLHEQTRDLAPVIKAAGQLFNAAVDNFQDSRQSEGQRLHGFIVERLDTMTSIVDEVSARAPQVRDLWLERLKTRLAEFDVDVDPARVAQEIVISAQRLDVAEELSRLSGHITEVRAVLERNEAIGRRLDFLMQELNREANTLSSKSQDEAMTRHAVDLKVLIEQLREQVQNIE